MKITQEIKDEAEQVVLDWMVLVDKADFRSAHQEASAFFRSKISVKKLESLLSEARIKTGKLGERKLTFANYHDVLPEASAGDYLIMQFVSQSAESKETVETITPVYENGQWRVCGYYVTQP